MTRQTAEPSAGLPHTDREYLPWFLPGALSRPRYDLTAVQQALQPTMAAQPP
ncbi:hypothetical protein [Roseiconus lacunae]|uniref:hypothetical protein n=1 Tax=Roseiconus lacunae TaxID=2605694 RepID=UPI0013598DB4|nr:hypothetical protein [Roseiconus lacunae]